jgi:hypothetical protein
MVPTGAAEVYVPPYSVSPTYYRNVNPTVVNITVVNVTNGDYVYRHLPKAVTVVRQEAFLRSDPITTRSIVAVTKPEITSARVAPGTAAAIIEHVGTCGPAVAHTPPRPCNSTRWS